MAEYVKIKCCGDCIQYNWKKHKCRLGATEEGKAQDHFYRDCPLGIYEEETHGVCLDVISRAAAISVADYTDCMGIAVEDVKKVTDKVVKGLKALPPAEPTLYGYKIEHLAYIARVMEKEGVTAEYAVRIFDNVMRAVNMIFDELNEILKERG